MEVPAYQSKMGDSIVVLLFVISCMTITGLPYRVAVSLSQPQLDSFVQAHLGQENLPWEKAGYQSDHAIAQVGLFSVLGYEISETGSCAHLFTSVSAKDEFEGYRQYYGLERLSAPGAEPHWRSRDPKHIIGNWYRF